MGFRTDTRILTTQGFVPVQNVQAGMLCLTPLGETPVLSCTSTVLIRNNCFVFSPDVAIHMKAFVLGVDRAWRLLTNHKATTLLHNIGVYLDPHTYSEPLVQAPEDVLSFKPVQPFPASPALAREPTEDWHLITGNGLVVADAFVFSAGDVINYQGVCAENVTLPVITSQHIEDFQNAHY